MQDLSLEIHAVTVLRRYIENVSQKKDEARSVKNIPGYGITSVHVVRAGYNRNRTQSDEQTEAGTACLKNKSAVTILD